MINPCGCNEKKQTTSAAFSADINQELPVPVQCPTVVHETVCVQAQVKITPDVCVGDIQSFCDGPAVIGSCEGTVREDCTFDVRQSICVQVPLTFSACATADPTGIVCGTPEVGSCGEVIGGCTFTIGYYKNHPEFTNQLITEAGGSIILGINGDGASFTVTTTNANDVLDFNVPSPPAPPSSPPPAPLAQQYQQLYAQLLAANLNVLNGATCEFATAAIAAANAFLAASEAGVGMEGAPAVQEPLEKFNAGNATEEGCPGHCP